MYSSQTYTLTPELPSAFLHRLVQKEVSAWDHLYDLYAPGLYGIIVRKVPPGQSGEMLTVIFLHLYANIHLYSEDKERLFTWMYKITKMICDEVAMDAPDQYIPATQEAPLYSSFA